ncbi:hypothetical protein Pth03_72440 [Planotetraspora thailandica]|uniref:S-adenosyl methyltransferase n=1 Tax=Planotetraspora thailandica TaxID=487172 RepID=A0A8J3Y162_9ACTN|nr:SAM-dependent methyltransferase [Planotetraspora thailandica]GII58855.1 hypothetical protein Pth03_72440 [Planotetraspora thailandica]
MSGAERRGVPGFNTSAANIARMSDYLLGGKDNFAADRELAQRLLTLAPEIKDMAVEVRDFQERVVRYLVDQGIRQFVNVSSGLPTQRNTHEVAQSMVTDARVVYIDDDPVVLTHGRAILATNPNTGVVKGNLLHPAELLDNPEIRRLIDFEQPVGLLIPARLQYLPDTSDPYKSVAYLRDHVARGSYLAIGHAVFDARPDLVGPIVEAFRRILPNADDAPRRREDVLRFFDGTELVEPGLVYIRRWRPESTAAASRPEKAWIVGGVGLIS